jgi:hypothetical protein
VKDLLLAMLRLLGVITRFRATSKISREGRGFYTEFGGRYLLLMNADEVD